MKSRWPLLCSYVPLEQEDGTLSQPQDMDALTAALGVGRRRVTRVLFAGQVIGGFVPEQPIDDQIEWLTIPTAA